LTHSADRGGTPRWWIPTGVTVNNEAELVAATARFSWPLASSYLAVSVQDLMAADNAGTGPRLVGEDMHTDLLYQDDIYLREFEATVLAL